MNQAIEAMLKRYNASTLEDKENALKEILQELCLLALWRAKFFEHAAFYGDTALRIFYDLPRFSEDLDFSLLKANPNFSWDKYEKSIVEELEAHGFQVSFKEKKKGMQNSIKSAFLKTGSFVSLLEIGLNSSELTGVHKHSQIKIKVEIDTQPEVSFQYEQKFLKMPLSCPILCVTKENLFAAKAHAAFFRKWKNRLKGRDWFDFVWFIQQGIPLDLSLFSQFMQQDHQLSEQGFLDLASEKIEHLDIKKAVQDISPFLSQGSLDFWSDDYFKYWLKEIHFTSAP